MKKKFSKILGIGLTLALVVSLLLTAVPVMAATAVTQLTVTLSPTTISLGSNYTITFDATNAVTATADGTPFDIIIAFPLGTPNPTLVTGDVTVQSTAGFGTARGPASLDTTGITVTAATTTAGPIVSLDLLDELGGDIGEGAMVRIKFLNTKVTNPPTIGGYELTVKTSADTTAVTSPTYTTTAPTILPLPGVVERYNSAGILMFQYNSISGAITAASAGDVIQVGPGTYDEDLTIAKSITVVGNAATTIIDDISDGSGGAPDGTGGKVTISFDKTATAAGVVFDGFTVKGDRAGDNAIVITGIGVTVQNCIITKSGTATANANQTMVVVNPTNPTTTYGNTITSNTFDTTLGTRQDIGVDVQSTNGENTTISNNTFAVDGAYNAGDVAIQTADGSTAKPTTISGNTISGASGVGVKVVAGGLTSVTDNTFTGLHSAFNIAATAAVTIKSNVIDACGIATSTTTQPTAGQAAIQVVSVAGTTVSITNNTISNSLNDIIEIAAAGDSSLVTMMFNNLTDYAKGIDNNDTTVRIFNATHNWWGAATGPATGMNTAATGGATNNTAGYLGGEATGNFALASATLVTKTTVGVDVTATGTTAPAIIGVANYSANPQSATPLPAIADGFYDVYLAEATAGDSTSVLIKFYNSNISANTVVYVWGTLAGGWVPVAGVAGSTGVNTYEGYAYATITGVSTPSIAGLAGTPFALCEASLAALTAPAIISPEGGERDIPLTPTFSWTQIAAAAGYYFELADNANFVAPLVKLDGDLGRLITTAYAYVTELPYSEAYYWRVKAVSGTIDAGTLAQSAWASGVFITMDEPPAEPDPESRMWICPQCGLTYSTREKLEAHAGWAHLPEEPADIVITSPDIEVIVPLPDVVETQITPTWIYIIIGVGAVLVIALLVLIVRTRRVA